MKLFNNSFEDFNSIDPLAVYNYLQENGWVEEGKIDTRAAILAINKRGRKFSVLLPLETEISDFSVRMSEVFMTLEIVEQRPQSEIITVFINSTEIAREKHCEILSLKFKFLYEQKKEMPAKKIGMVLTSLQDLFDAVGQSESDKISSTGKIQKEIADRTELSVFETFKGSFGVKLALAPNPDQLNLLERPLAERVAESFLELVKRSNNSDKEKLREFLLRLKRRSASRYRKFLLSLINAEANFCIDWGSESPDKGGQARLSFTNAVSTIEFINKMELETPEEYRINGELLSASKSRSNVEIQDIQQGKKYSGKVVEGILNSKEVELTIGRLYSAIIQELTSINPATGEEKVEFTIVEILPLDPDFAT